MYVQKGLHLMAGLNGEVWFKLDSVTQTGRLRINNTRASLQRMRDNLQTAASLCPTWLQTCVFKLKGVHPDTHETDAYIGFIRTLLQEGTKFGECYCTPWHARLYNPKHPTYRKPIRTG